MTLKKFYTYLWRIAIRKNNTDGKLPSLADPFYVIKNPWWGWLADPFLIEENGHIFLFAEIYSYFTDRGYLGYAEIIQGQLTPWKVIIKEKYHLSFPNVFKIGSDFYLCPESYEDKTIHFYKAVSFPDKWVYDQTLVEGKEGADTVYYRKDNNNYGFTNINCFLYLFKIDKNKVEFSTENPIIEPVNSPRPAGKIISIKESDYRVSQIYNPSNEEGGVLFSRMNLQWPKYKETEVQRWNHSDVVLSNAKNTAFRIHTYNQSQHYEVIDLRYCEFLIFGVI